MSGSMPSPFGETLRTFRIRAGLSQEALAEASSVSARTISDLERGQRATAHLETIRRLASALGLSDNERRQFLESTRPDGISSPALRRSPVGPEGWAATLPIPDTPLIGRARELDHLLTLLSSRSDVIVTLTGPGGIGKTRLALEAAHRLASSFADGAAFVNLAPVTQPDQVPDAIARALGLTPWANTAADQLTAVLGTRELLLVLDNLEQVIDAAPFIAQLDAACPALAILVTSRIRLRVSRERALTIPPLLLADSNVPIEQLRTSDAIQLFAERARRADPRFELTDENVATVSEICRRLEGLPLAIELAASRLRVLSAPALLERLNRRLPLLTGGDRDLPPRQQSMRDTIAWSYELLDPAAKRLLRWMSVFTGGLSLESSEALGAALGLDQNGSLDAVTTLVDFGLAARSGASNGFPRFHLLETIREFGLERLAAAGELDAARLFHALHFLEFARRDAPRPYEPIRPAWVGRLATEHPNLIEAFDFLCAPETAEQSLQFAAAMGPYWHTRGPFSEWQPRQFRAFELASPEPTILKAHVLFWLSLILSVSPDFSVAVSVASRGIDIASQAGTISDKAAAIQIMAIVYECHEHWDTARELREEAIGLWISVENSYMHAICLVLNAGIAYAGGELDRARRDAEQARTMFQAVGDIDWLAATEWYQGVFAVADVRLDQGAVYYEQSLRTWLQSESASRWYRPLVGLADVAATLGQLSSAARLLGAADDMLIVGGRDLTFYDRPGYVRAETRCRATLGSADFEKLRRAGSLLTPDAWLVEANEIVDAVRTSTIVDYSMKHGGPAI